MTNPEDLPQWFMDLYLDFFHDLTDNKDKFKNTGSAKIVDHNDKETKKGYAIHNPEEDVLTFVGIRDRQNSDEINYCHIKTEYTNG